MSTAPHPKPDRSSQAEYPAIYNASLFQGVEERALAETLQAASRVSVDKGSFVFMQGDPAERLYLLALGKLKLTQVTPEGQQVILHYSVEGEILGAVAALSHSEYPVSAQAVQDSLLLAWDNQSIRNLMHKHSTLSQNLIQIMATRMREFQERLREMATERVERRIARALLRLARQTGRKIAEGVLIGLPVTRQDLAEMTGTTIYTVSRTLSHWESLGLIHSRREQIAITSPHGLVSIAEDLPPPQPSPAGEDF